MCGSVNNTATQIAPLDRRNVSFVCKAKNLTLSRLFTCRYFKVKVVIKHLINEKCGFQ